jgi:hypothetical protein
MTVPGSFAPGDVLTDTDMNGLPGGRKASATKTTAQNSIGTSATDLSSLTVTFTALAGRKYRITGQATFVQAATASTAILYLLASGTQIALSSDAVVGTFGRTQTVIAEHSPGAGSVTYKLQASCDSGTINLSASSTAPSMILVEDIGT